MLKPEVLSEADFESFVIHVRHCSCKYVNILQVCKHITTNICKYYINYMLSAQLLHIPVIVNSIHLFI